MSTVPVSIKSEDSGAVAAAAFVPLCEPHITGNEWRYVKECLDTGWVSSVGPFVDRFERAVAESIGAKCAVATVNGTAALHVALLVAGVEPDDEVLVPTLTFIAPANAVRYANAWPVFIDAEPDYWQMDPQRVAAFLRNDCCRRNGQLENRTTGRRVKAILPVHVLGHPVDIDPIVAAAREYGLAVVEDATESLGARYKGRSVGRLADIACFSFNGNKIITTGGGGMIVTDNDAWAEQARYLTTQAKDDPVEYIHQHIGFNYRLTNVQAALGVAQMEVLDGYVAAKRRIIERYAAGLRDVLGMTPMHEAEWAHSTFWLSTVLVDPAQYGMSSRELLGRLHDARIQSRPLWQPLHCSPAHAGMQAVGGAIAEKLAATALSLPSSVGLGDEAQQRVIGEIANAVQA